MKLVLRIALCCSLAVGLGIAQRRGGGGFSGGGFRGGGGFAGGGFRGGGGFVGGGFRGGGGFVGGGFRGGFVGVRRPFVGFGWGGGWPLWGGGWPLWGGSAWVDPGWGAASYPASDAGWGGGYYAGYQQQSSPNVTVIYPPQASAQPANTVYVERSVTREYDQYGQEINRPAAAAANSGPAVYLIAFKDHTIRAAAAYWAVGGTLHYVTLEHEEKLAPLVTVDRDLSGQLNRERRVTFSLPASQ